MSIFGCRYVMAIEIQSIFVQEPTTSDDDDDEDGTKDQTQHQGLHGLFVLLEIDLT